LLASVLSAFSPTSARAESNPPAVSVSVDADFSWYGKRDCDQPRPHSVVCIAGSATVPMLGFVEYARDAVPESGKTKDGCPKFSTAGRLWVKGGTATFTGTPEDTCGGPNFPDAHYAVTVAGGTGTLAGIAGTIDVVADHGIDHWKGVLLLQHEIAAVSPAPAAPARPPASATNPLPIVIIVLLAGGIATLAVLVGLRARRRRGSASVPRPD